MRLLPRSLFARMLLVLFGGLVIAQLLTFALHWRERGEYVTRAVGMRAAQRIADIVRLLDTIAPVERATVVEVLGSPPLRISLGDMPLGPPAPDAGKEEQAAQFEAALRRVFEADVPLVVQAVDTPPRGAGFGKGRGLATADAGMPGGGPFGPEMRRRPGIWFVVKTELQDRTPVTFRVRQPSEPVILQPQLLLDLAVLVAVLCLVAYFAVRWVTRPLNTLAAAAQELGENINRPPLDESGPREVSRAAHAFNVMQQRLAKFISDRTRIFSAMSHDLKTPITRLRLRAEMLDDAALRGKFVKDLVEMESMVGAALDFMRGIDDHQPPQSIDMTALLESLQEDARETGGNVRIEGAPRAPFAGNPQALKRCLGNLIDNAVRYGKSAAIAVEDADDCLRLSVRDEGPGIPETELERVFDPFYRLENSRSRETGGTGLGLTIARSVARAHGGELVLRNGQTGGLEAVLTLPRRRI